MARAFVKASSQYLYVNSTPITTYPYSFVGWFNFSDITQSHPIGCIGDKDVGYNVSWYVASGDQGGDPLRFCVYDNTTFRQALGETYAASAWHHICAVGVSVNSRRIIYDGDVANQGTDTATGNMNSYDRICIGAVITSAFGEYCNGAIAEVALYNAVLSDANITLLANKYSPALVQPTDLVAYWKLIDDDNDSKGAYHLTPMNSPTYTDHVPGMIYSSGAGINPCFKYIQILVQ